MDKHTLEMTTPMPTQQIGLVLETFPHNQFAKRSQ